MAILEPALSESVGATSLKYLKMQQMKQHAEEFHTKQPKTFYGPSDYLACCRIRYSAWREAFRGCLLAISEAEPVIFKDGWLDKVFAPEAVKASVRLICK